MTVSDQILLELVCLASSRTAVPLHSPWHLLLTDGIPEQEAAAGNAWRGLQFLNEAKQLEADGDHDAAERSYSQAMDRVAHPDVLASFANFLQTVRGEHSRAESM